MKVLETYFASALLFSIGGVFMIITSYEQLKSFQYKPGIYIFINKKYPSKKYVGKANDLFYRIANQHKNAKSKQYIHRTIRRGKDGLLNNFYVELIHWWDNPVDTLEVLALETACIDAYDCLVEKGGYNICLFGNDTTGYKHTKESLEKISIASKGRKFSNLHKHRLSIARIGFHPSQKTKNKLRIINSGKKLSEITKEKISTTLKGKFCGSRNSNYNPTIFKFKNKITNKIFEGTQYDFYTKFDLSPNRLSRVLKGKNKSIKSWILV